MVAQRGRVAGTRWSNWARRSRQRSVVVVRQGRVPGTPSFLSGEELSPGGGSARQSCWYAVVALSQAESWFSEAESLARHRLAGGEQFGGPGDCHPLGL